MLRTVTLRGSGLFSGEPATVSLSVHDGPLSFVARGRERAMGQLRPTAGTRTTELASEEGVHLSCVEHLFAALGGLSVGHGLRVECSAAELPLLDGGALAWTTALESLALATSPARTKIVRPGTLVVGQSVYELVPGASRACAVELEMGDLRLERKASWDGSRTSFVQDIAPARTFVDELDLVKMSALGMKVSADPESVVVIGRSEIFTKGRPFTRSEPARHKLLDLIGDLTAHGGPPLGTIRVLRPGHAATHEAMARARASKLIDEAT